MIEIYKRTNNKCDTYIDTFKRAYELIQFIEHRAKQLNHGNYTMIIEKNRIYFNCGSVIYYADDLDESPCL